MTVLYNLLNRQYKAKIIYDVVERNAIKYGYISKKKSSFSIEPKGIELIQTLNRLKIDFSAPKLMKPANYYGAYSKQDP